MMETLSFGICFDSFFGQRRVGSVVIAIENLQKNESIYFVTHLYGGFLITQPRYSSCTISSPGPFWETSRQYGC